MALPADPPTETVGARLARAGDLLRAGQPAEALSLLDAGKVPVRDQDAARDWMLLKSLALLKLGRADVARAAMDVIAALGPVPPALTPLIYWRLVLLAVLDGDVPGARQKAERMEKWLAAGAEMALDHRIQAHEDLASFWSRQGEPARAFAHWTRGHDLLWPEHPFLRDRHAAFIDANIAAFTSARFLEQRAANRDRIPVFLVGMPHSGIETCEHILATHGMVHSAGERSALADGFAELGGGRDAEAVRRIAATRGHLLDKPAGRFITALRALAREKSRILDTTPANYLYLGLAGLIVPGARMIHCLRDPRDIGLSIFTGGLRDAPAYAHDLGDLGFAIAQQLRLMDHWRAAMPGRIITVKLSDWDDDFAGTLDRVLTHLELPPDANCTRPPAREPGGGEAATRWGLYEAELKPLIAELDKAGALAGWDG